MSKPLVDRIPFKKIVTACSVGIAVGFGFCGLNAFLEAHGIARNTFERGFSALLVFDLVLLGVSFIGLVVSSIAWAVLSLQKRFVIGIDKSE